mmetsp:Transcript_13888/g.36908  ORF Transcript_13888/g.36908 Transcript_13888/m.36908 type:complete len:80 (+) Transcript_13888:112-351(+)
MRVHQDVPKSLDTVVCTSKPTCTAATHGDVRRTTICAHRHHGMYVWISSGKFRSPFFANTCGEMVCFRESNDDGYSSLR